MRSSTNSKVLLGFSGGIDSCAAVEILQYWGLSVTALTLDMTGDQQLIDNAAKKAAELGVEFIVADVREQFDREIVNYFVDEYLSGRTPAPCTLCNPRIKWKTLVEIADRYGIDKIATGHYFGIEQSRDKYYITRGADPIKDQTYYLWGLSQQTLSRIVTPMFNVIKSEVRRATIDLSSQKESMGLCFLGGRGYPEFILERTNNEIPPGEIINSKGEVVATHDGFPFYTIGQKRGMNLPNNGCIVAIDALCNRLTAGTDADLYHTNLVLGGINVVDMDEILSSNDISIMIRGLGRNPEGHCTITNHPSGLHIKLDNPAWAAAVGQPAVLYRGNRLIGGGILEKYY